MILVNLNSLMNIKSTLTYFNTPSSVFHIMMYAFLELDDFFNLAVNTAYIYIM